jgi:hypothetical protein
MFHLAQRSIDQARIKSFRVEAKVFQFREQGVPMRLSTLQQE